MLVGPLAIAVLSLLLAACGRSRPAEPAYVDSAACAGCHPAAAAAFRRTGMGRSFYRPRPQDQVPATFYHQPSDRHYAMLLRDGRYYQRRHQIGYDGRETNVVEKEVHFIISWARAITLGPTSTAPSRAASSSCPSAGTSSAAASGP